MDVFNETMRSWQNFYFMAGGAAASLLGLMFVALSLGMHLISEDTRDAMKIFVTPSIIYFVSVLVLAGIMLVPSFTPQAFTAVLFLGGALGLVNAVPNSRGLFRTAMKHQDFNRYDWLFQIILPVVNYLLILIAGVVFLRDQWPLAFMVVWLATVSLLITAIANTWSLVIWIIDQRLN